MKLAEKIVVIGPGGTGVRKAWIVESRTYSVGVVHDFVWWYAELMPRQGCDGDVLASSEGVTWARGWDSPEANALRTVARLS